MDPDTAEVLVKAEDGKAEDLYKALVAAFDRKNVIPLENQDDWDFSVTIPVATGPFAVLAVDDLTNRFSALISRSQVSFGSKM